MTELASELERAWQTRQAHHPPEITFAYPLDTALISLTGDRTVAGTICSTCSPCGRRRSRGQPAR